MMVMERRPATPVRSEYEAELSVERTDIWFEDVPGDRVRIQVTVHNRCDCASRPTVMRLESAPLGAFVPWQPLAVLPVPALAPGESREISAKVPRPHPAPLGDFDRIPPQKLLTALSAPDQSPPPPSRMVKMINLFRRQPALQPQTRIVTARRNTLVPGNRPLAPDLRDLVGQGRQLHWAGNINVFIGQRAVERHLARALRVYPGKTNSALFIVGERQKPDAYAFNLKGLASDWKSKLSNCTNLATLRADPTSRFLEEAQWVESTRQLLVTLTVRPPADCKNGNLEVHVTERSTRKTVIVEFDMEPSSQGPGCYVC
jgi:hypothetical protein